MINTGTLLIPVDPMNGVRDRVFVGVVPPTHEGEVLDKVFTGTVESSAPRPWDRFTGVCRCPDCLLMFPDEFSHFYFCPICGGRRREEPK